MARDEKQLIALVKLGRQQLEEQWSRERVDRMQTADQRGAGFAPQGDDD